MNQDERTGSAPWAHWGLALLLFGLLAGVGFLAYSQRNRLGFGAGTVLAADGLFDASEESLPDLEKPLANPGFLGPQACAPCHAKRVEEFLQTNHAHAMRRTEPSLMPPGFKEGHNRIATDDPDFHFEMIQEGDNFYQKTWTHRVDGKWEPDAHKIDFVYGWGRLDEVNFSWEKDHLLELPAAWIYPNEAWGVASTYHREVSPTAAREATPNCLECHTTWFSHYPGTPNRYQPDSFILGVSCERCHGPGKEHVSYHESHPQEKQAVSIVQPGKLPRERQIEVCTQCHSNAIREKGRAFSYRVGEPLDEFFRTIHPKNPEDDHVANQITSLRQSKCFQKSETLSCATCHDPHRPHEPAKTSAASPSCAQCHKPDACKERPKLPEGVREDCTGCHMPPRVWMNVNFHIKDDHFVPPIRRFEHRIAVHPEATKTVLLQYDQAHDPQKKAKEIQERKAELVHHWLQEAKARRADFRILGAIGAIREGLRIEPKHQELNTLLATSIREQTELFHDSIHAEQRMKEGDPHALKTAQALWEKVLALKPIHALAHGKLGAVHASLGHRELARKELLSVAQLDPDEAYGFALLGWLAYLDGQPEEAIGHFRRADEIEPHVALTHYRMGLAYLQLQNWPAAVKALEKALEIDPQLAGARQGLSHALRNQGKKRESLIQARLATRLTAGTNPDVLLTLVEAYVENGDLKRAKIWAERGLEMAHKAHVAGLEARLRGRLKKLESAPS